MKSRRFWLMGLVLMFGMGWLAGCATDPWATESTDPWATSSPGTLPAAVSQVDGQPIIHVGDNIVVTFQDLQPPIAPVEVAVKEDGKITLIYNKSFQAAGRTAGQLEDDIRTTYVTNYFKNMTPTVTVKERFYFVRGEVKQEGRQVYIGRMTVLQAIATAGGFGEFANRKKVSIIRGKNKPIVIDAVKALTDPKQNVEIFPGDIIDVPKKWI